MTTDHFYAQHADVEGVGGGDSSSSRSIILDLPLLSYRYVAIDVTRYRPITSDYATYEENENER